MGTSEGRLARGSVALTLLAAATALAADLPVAATVLAASALLLALASVVLVLRGSPTRADVLRCALLVAGPVLLLVGTRVLLHVATPCWTGEVPGVCEAATDGGVGLPATVHPFWSALLGWVPLALLHVWALRRWWPEAVPDWVPEPRRARAPDGPWTRPRTR